MKWSFRKAIVFVIAVLLVCFVVFLIFQYIRPRNEDPSLSCCVHDPVVEGPLCLVCIGSCSMDTVDAYGQQRLTGLMDEYGYCSMSGGSHENSGSSYTILHLPDDAESWVTINNGNAFITKRDIHSRFCESCATKITETLSFVQRHTYVLYDAVAGEFHPIAVGTEQIGNYIVETTREKGGYKMVVTTLS